MYAGRLAAPPTWTRHAEATHYAASTMKLAVLAALYRAADIGRLDLDAPATVHNRFTSAQPDAPAFSCARQQDNDDAVWDRLGDRAPLRWLAERMIVKSSNLATNLLIEHVGLAAVADLWARVGARHSVTGRGIEDFAARDAGITNLVTAADLADLLDAVATGAARSGSASPPSGPAGLAAASPPFGPAGLAAASPASGPARSGFPVGSARRQPVCSPAGSARTEPVVSPAGCAAMLDVLCAQQIRQDIAEGLPAGTRLAHKNGWVRGVRHGAAVIFPDDAPAYLLVVCTSRPVPDDQPSGRVDRSARHLVADISALVWRHRHDL
ncbi:hypothetical protein Jiend_47050 [Micromonospora endophytica]|nr:hypothetical protein Jiend_47050 [Micromonospora endophytica]